MTKKTNYIHFIAQLMLTNIIQPSRVLLKAHREFRSYIWLCHKFVQKTYI